MQEFDGRDIIVTGTPMYQYKCICRNKKLAYFHLCISLKLVEISTKRIGDACNSSALAQQQISFKALLLGQYHSRSL